jgi:hypothetical protein
VRSDNLAAERQAQPHTALFIGLKGLEQMLRNLRGNAQAIVLNPDLDPIVNLTEADPHPPLAVAAFGYGLDRIPDQINKHLLYLNVVARDKRQRPPINPDGHAVCSSLVGKHADHLARNPRKINRTPPWLTPPQEIPEPFNDVASPIDFGFYIG